MVTPKIIYTDEERRACVANSANIIDTYEKSESVGLVVEVRFDILLKEQGPFADKVLEYSDSAFFLLKLHYKLFLFAIYCLDWKLEISYEAFKEFFEEMIQGLPVGNPLLVRLTFKSDGAVEGSVEEAEAVSSMLSGLLDHWRLLQCDNETMKKNNDVNAISVCIDNEATLPSYLTSFKTNIEKPFAAALERVQSSCKNTSPAGCATSATGQERESPNKETKESSNDVYIPRANCAEFHSRIDTQEPYSVENTIIPLLYNPIHQVMGSSGWNLCFFRNGRWYTPHISTGCCNDPLVSLLLELGILEEASIQIQGLHKYEDVLLISSSRGIKRGKIVGDPPAVLSKFRRTRASKAKTNSSVNGNKVNPEDAAYQTSLAMARRKVSSRSIPLTTVFRASGW